MRFSALLAAFFGLAPGGHNRFQGLVASNSKSNGQCRTAHDWNTLLDSAKAKGFKKVRIFGNDCNAYDLVGASAKARGMTVLAGVYANSGTIAASLLQINADVKAFVAALKKHGHATFEGFTVGNEVNDSAQNIMNKVRDVRGHLHNDVGYRGPVSTVHTWGNRVFIRDHPIMCDADRVTANAHAYYDGGVTAADAGSFVSHTVYPALTHACPGKNIVITESGWPSRGGNNGKAVPSLKHEQAALKGLNCAASGGAKIWAFEADDLAWKGNDVERSFGVLNKGLNFADIFTC